MHKKSHWETVYTTKESNAVSWFQPHAVTSIEFINRLNCEKSAAIIDVGGGASTLVDDLLLNGHTNVSVLDLSGAALETAKKRIGESSANVKWIEADITGVTLPKQQFDVWHDRAVFHFLTTPEERRAYIKNVLHALKPHGHIIIATFSEDGPEKCSGLPIVRYSAESLHGEFGDHFVLKDQRHETHKTPFGTTQEFVFCHFVKKG
ncbi:Ubiquinone/menaquinone biosynthesis C-methyltransferase UbiE [Pseudoalteromonas sp. P1-9]|uniref:class I SAM-dependent methyltransferase n=1 Tax=Pseudoalteromonas sp. P1-9 TaxID=1710354 RepID=UPI0006D64F82|nr:class I SAM-dependent methyltransferase [Pseudoalteromonas sp. P1-9]KPV98279.1 Ubiquinone/menaquinone biosynthesis C-methyltransferase UbiE [Pseudoalteromonas sp. P1-9]